MDQLTKIIDQYGFGGLAFLALGYGGYRLLNWLDKVHTTLDLIRTNHLHHIQEDMAVMRENSTRANEMLQGHGKSLDSQSQMLSILVDRSNRG